MVKLEKKFPHQSFATTPIAHSFATNSQENIFNIYKGRKKSPPETKRTRIFRYVDYAPSISAATIIKT